MKLSNRLSLPTVLIVTSVLQIVGTVGLVGYLSFRNGQQAVSYLAKRLIREQGDRVALYLESYTDVPPQVTQDNANEIRDRHLPISNLAEWRSHLFQQSQTFPKLGYIYFANTQGEYVEWKNFEQGMFRLARKSSQASVPIIQTFSVDANGELKSPVGERKYYDARSRPGFRLAQQQQRPGWTQIYQFLEDQLTLGISFVRPHYDQQKRFQGVLGADFALTDINRFLKQISNDSRIFIIERDGNVVATSSGQPPFTAQKTRLKAVEMDDLVTRTTAQQMQERVPNLLQIRDRQQLQFQLDGKDHFVEIAPFSDEFGLDWLIVLAVPESAFIGQIEQNTHTTALLCLAALGLAIAGNILTARWLTKPLCRLSQATQKMAQGDFQQQVKVRGSREVRALSQSFNQMSQEIQRSHLQLEDYARSLEEKVQERTKELQQEVEEHRRTEDRLRLANAELHALFSAMDQLIFVYDREGRHLKIPAQSQQRLLYRPNMKRIGRTLHEVLPPEMADRFLKNIQRSLDTQTNISLEYTLDIDEKTVWSDAVISPIDESTALWVSRNITDRKEAEQQLQQSNENLRRTLEELKATQAKLIEAEKLAALGQLVAGVAHEMNTPLGAIRSSVENVSEFMEQTLSVLPEFLQLLPFQRQRDFFALVQRSEESFAAIARLSSREKRQLKRALIEQLNDRQIAQSDFIADTLMDIGVYENLEPFWELLADPDRDSILRMAYQLTSLQRSVNTIFMATNQASTVVKALRTYTRQETQLARVETDVIDSIETALTLYHNQIKRGVEVVRQFEPVPSILGFPDELNQVWTNLIHNALQAMACNGKLTIAVRSEPSMIHVSVTDTGAGIPPEIQPRIFEPFFTTKSSGEGNGLGLCITQRIIEKHEGTIAVESVPGCTTFTVSLPVFTEVSEI